MATRDDIIANMQAAYTAAGLTVNKKDCDTNLNIALTAIADTVMAEEGSQVRTCIGTFKYNHRAARDGRNPKTGEVVAVAARNSLAFKAAPAYNQAEVEAPKKAKAAKKAEATPATASAKKVVKKPVKK